MESLSVNLYTAIMKAADHIERNPKQYAFHATLIPPCGTPGCMLGWIGHFAGVGDRRDVLEAVNRELLGLHGDDHTDCEFYDRIEASQHFTKLTDAPSIAKCLREYAETYHGHQKPTERNFARELEQKLLTEQPEELAI